MAQWLIVAWDGTDAEAPERRRAVREAHLTNVAPMVEVGELMIGGAILNEEGGMIGSACVVEFDTRAKLDQWLATDPYVTGGVWRRMEIHPMRVAVQSVPRSAGIPAGPRKAGAAAG